MQVQHILPDADGILLAAASAAFPCLFLHLLFFFWLLFFLFLFLRLCLFFSASSTGLCSGSAALSGFFGATCARLASASAACSGLLSTRPYCACSGQEGGDADACKQFPQVILVHTLAPSLRWICRGQITVMSQAYHRNNLFQKEKRSGKVRVEQTSVLCGIR